MEGSSCDQFQTLLLHLMEESKKTIRDSNLQVDFPDKL
jgi:hypothetical protein